LQGWAYRKAVTLSRASGAVSNYQMRLLVGETSGASGEDVDCNGHVQADFDDLRLTTADGTTLLGYWIELITGATPNQLATVWIKFDSIGTGATTFYMYYGKSDAPAVSSRTATMVKADNGAAGNFTETMSGTATLTHESGKYKVTEDSLDDAALAGYALPDWSFKTFIRAFGAFTGITTASHQTLVGLFDSDTIANLKGTAAGVGPKRRFYIARICSNAVSNANRFYIIYQNSAGTFYYWDGDSWTTAATSLPLSSGDVEIRFWSDGTNVYADILGGGTSLLTAVASIPISSVKPFSSGKCFAWGDIYTDAYGFTQGIDDYFIQQYVSPEPAWGSWGSEQTN
jgi:hypothetical protein